MNFHGLSASLAGPPSGQSLVMTCVQVVNIENAIKLNIHVRVQGLSANGCGKKGKSEQKHRKKEATGEHKKTVSLVWSN